MKMNEERLLINQLLQYSQSEMKPAHMPGHKRKGEFPNPFTIDITEIDGFDNLHHPEGILKDSMEWASNLYGSDKTYYLVNGSSCGILSAISASISFNGKILMSRNSHKAAYHGVFLKHLKTTYIYPQKIVDFNINGGLLLAELENMLITDSDIEAVFIVSPTYDGIVSDIYHIAEIVHRYDIPLIVDEAHGAHFSFGDIFPKSALSLGADIVIQSVHKTLLSLTQTAIMHVKSKLIDIDKLEYYLNIYQSSSPSYVFMASIERCLYQMSCMKENEFRRFDSDIRAFYKKAESLKYLKLMDRSYIGKFGIFDIDLSKLVISSINSNITGSDLGDLLRDKYHIEMEMAQRDYVLGIITIQDDQKMLHTILAALTEIDQNLAAERQHDDQKADRPIKIMEIYEAEEKDGESLLLENCYGRISKEFIYVYPPGIPFIVPGEMIDKNTIDLIKCYLHSGLSVQGPSDQFLKYINVVK